MIPTKSITLSLKDFLEILLREKAKVSVRRELAELIKLLDKGEELCHVELPDGENHLDAAEVWNRQDWMNDLVRYERVKKQAEIDRIAWNERKSKIWELQEAILDMTQMPEDYCLELATHIFDSRKSVAALKFGVTL